MSTRTFRTIVHEGPYKGEFFVTLTQDAIERGGNDVIENAALRQARPYMSLGLASVWVDIVEEIEELNR